jgi:phosphoglycerate dehydrogenase-like enzyme
MNNNLGIIGVGKLGICYAIILAKAGYNVYIYDITPTEKKNETILFIFIYLKTMF